MILMILMDVLQLLASFRCAQVPLLLYCLYDKSLGAL